MGDEASVARSSPALGDRRASDGPLVSVVTPVFNGAAHLEECIESVLAQTYQRWEYVIVDNCSTDGTAEIAGRYGTRDRRIRLVSNDRFLDMIPNWNHALRQISPESRYCKVIHSDDVMTPDCLERMVRVAEEHASVGIVSAYRLSGDEVDLDGAVPWGVEVMCGREICRMTLLEGRYAFGSPSSLLIRADLIRERRAFYNEDNVHADTEICFDVLRTADFGFVHQVLTYTRRHAASSTSTTGARLGTNVTGWLRVMTTFGRFYLTRDEYDCRLSWWLRRYAIFLAKSVVSGRARSPQFREVHLRTLAMLRRSVGASELARGMILTMRLGRSAIQRGSASAC
jgi:glycosyltransferase involved in cell wall biosynthesis